MSHLASPTFDDIRLALLAAKTESERLCVVESLLAKYLPFIRLLAGSLLDRRQRAWMDSEDVRQSIGIRLAERLKDGRIELMTEGEFKSLLRTMVRNLVLAKQRIRTPKPLSTVPDDDSASRALEPADDSDSPSHQVATHETAHYVLDRLEALLQPDEFYCMQKRVLEGLDFSEIALQLGTTADAARMRFNRAMTRVRESFPQWEAWIEER